MTQLQCIKKERTKTRGGRFLKSVIGVMRVQPVENPKSVMSKQGSHSQE